MKEFDLVKAIVDIENIKINTEGVIVYIYDGHDACEVEFFDNKNNTIDVVTCKFEQLELIKESK